MSPSPFIVEWVERVARELAGADADSDGRQRASRREARVDSRARQRPWQAGARSGSAARRRALDVAMGRGRHAIMMARAGFRTFGVDVKFDAIAEACAAARHSDVTIHAWCADLTQHPLPLDRFDLIVVTRYLQRDLFPALQRAVRPCGFVLYETFTTAQRALQAGPTSPDHLLEPGELRARFDVPEWETLSYEETREPEAVARLCARRCS